MMDGKHDDETPVELKRVLYRKPGWLGVWYRDVKGGERCPASWVGPCPHCHRREEEQAAKAATQSQKSATDGTGSREVVPVPYYEIAEVEEAAERAHAQASSSTEVEEQQYVYVQQKSDS
jgi:hypothetical protein